MSDWTKCSCGAEIPKALAEVGVGWYSCSQKVKHTRMDGKIQVSTAFFPHHDGERYETLVFSLFGPQWAVIDQEWDYTEELAVATHDRLVEEYRCQNTDAQ